MLGEKSLQNIDFTEILSIISNAQSRALASVNREMITMYWEIGRIVSEKTASDGWGKSTVSSLAAFLQSRLPGASGFSDKNIWRMKQFYETYKDNQKLSPLVREISWTNNLLIMTACKTDEAKEFYIRACIENRYSKRELERQIDSMLYERTAISDAKYGALIENRYSKRELERQIDSMLYERTAISDAKYGALTKRNEGLSALRDAYVLEFLDLPSAYREKDLRKQIVSHLKDFILELGKDFSFIGEEYRLQVGNTDFFIDLLFFNRSLSCLVAIELKIGMFRPEHLWQLNLYLEALDRDVKKPNENPSVGLILCTGKDDTVVEYSLSRSLSPAMVADYNLHLPDKKKLKEKMREIAELSAEELEENESN